MQCEICQTDRPNCGPYREGDRSWKQVCGGCKIKRVLADPARRARLETNIQAAAPVLKTEGCCRACRGPLKNVHYQPAMDGLCGECAYDEYDGRFATW
jgi:hypothetical protein